MRIELMIAESQPAVLPLNYGHHNGNTLNFAAMLAHSYFRLCQETEIVTANFWAAHTPSRMFVYMVEAQGLEPWTLGLKVRCSNQLSYTSMHTT